MALKRMTPASKATAKKVATRKAAAQKTGAKKSAKPLTKTATTKVSVADYLSGLSDQRRDEGKVLAKIFEKATGWKSQMWGPSIIGYGRYSYVYESGHHGDACVVGFSPRKGAVVLYLGSGTPEQQALLGKLGKVKTDGGCIYVNKLPDIDLAVLEKYVKASQAASLKNYKDCGWPVSAT